MNIHITYNWLLEYLETDADPYELQKYLSLCGPSVETVTKTGDDYVLDIEVTSNRVDMASVFGIAQETQAILPRFGKKAKLKLNPLTKHRSNLVLSEVEGPNNKKLDIQIKNLELCSRFTAIVLSGVEVKKSPEIISQRLKLCGISSINNIVDISNYLMLSLGQPTHIFDYDKIKNQKMLLRESKKGEKIKTLDDRDFELPGRDIVIEDGSGKLIDLCGIMGGKNSEVDSRTKNIVLFVQTYNKNKIRRTSMTTGQRSLAATYFEKGLDEERVELTLVYGVQLFKDYANAKVSSQLYDIYPKPYKPKSVDLAIRDTERIIGVKIKKEEIEQILTNLGFSINPSSTDSVVRVVVPSWRKGDISIKEDLIEEIARIYGYHNLPSQLQAMVFVKRDKNLDKLFEIEQKVRYFLKHLGLNESLNYSMVPKQTDGNLKISNPISEELTYMRRSLLPSLAQNIKENRGKKDIIRFFEIAKVYYPRKNNLPDEAYKLGIATNTDFSDLKGIVEAILVELNIPEEKVIANLRQSETDSNIFFAEIDFQLLVENYRVVPAYRPINPFAQIKLDLTAKIENYREFKNRVFKISKYLQKIELIDTFKDKVTLRFYFASKQRNLTEKEAKVELEKIKETV